MNDGTRRQPTLRQHVEDFLFEEATLLDEWRLDDWCELFTEDARYVVPTTDLPEGDPERDLVFIDDDIFRLRARVKRLNQPPCPPGVSLVADTPVCLQRTGPRKR